MAENQNNATLNIWVFERTTSWERVFQSNHCRAMYAESTEPFLHWEQPQSTNNEFLLYVTLSISLFVKIL